MAVEQKLEIDGEVTEALPNLLFRVKLENDHELLAHLATDPERVFTRSELLRDVWNWPPRMHTRTLDSHASRLRRKLSAHGALYVVNVWGVGYRLIDVPASEPAGEVVALLA